jgi:(1->4)-alpha-D-glucan 1-alpha-D-glucosylmutase
MGLVLDVVPNHMAIGPDNRFWTDVLTHGEGSQYARWFDVAWRTRRGRSAPLHLPVLGDVRSRVIERGELGLVWDADRSAVVISTRASRSIPRRSRRSVETAARALGGSRELAAIAAGLGALPARALPARPAIARARPTSCSRAWPRSPAATRGRRRARARGRTDRAARAGGAARAPALSARLLAARRGRHQLPPLLRGERARRAPRRGRGGLRGDARAAPRLGRGTASSTSSASTTWTVSPTRSRTCRALRRLLDGAGGRDVGVVVEKIVAHDEQVRAEWPIAGTTGYEVARALEDVFIDRRGFAALVDWYARHDRRRPGRWLPGDRVAGQARHGGLVARARRAAAWSSSRPIRRRRSPAGRFARRSSSCSSRCPSTARTSTVAAARRAARTARS